MKARPLSAADKAMIDAHIAKGMVTRLAENEGTNQPYSFPVKTFETPLRTVSPTLVVA